MPNLQPIECIKKFSKQQSLKTMEELSPVDELNITKNFGIILSASKNDTISSLIIHNNQIGIMSFVLSKYIKGQFIEYSLSYTASNRFIKLVPYSTFISGVKFNIKPKG